MRETIRIEKSYPHPVERVWRAISTRDGLEAWLMPNDFEARVGHRFTFRTDPAPGFDGIVDCEVLRLEERRLLSFSWRGGPGDTVVTIELASTGNGGTTLTMEQSGFRGVRGRLVGWMLKAGGESLYGKRLPELLDRWAGEQGGTSPFETQPDAEDEACMSRKTGFLARLASIGRRSRLEEDERTLPNRSPRSSGRNLP